MSEWPAPPQSDPPLPTDKHSATAIYKPATCEESGVVTSQDL